MPQASVTIADIEKFRRRAEVCRAEAEMVWEPGRRQERLNTALAYERIAERAKHHVRLSKYVLSPPPLPRNPLSDPRAASANYPPHPILTKVVIDLPNRAFAPPAARTPTSSLF